MTIIQSSISSNSKKGTIRGLHHLIPPHEERKLVTCTHGSMFDVLVDLRKDSPTHLQWVSIALSADSWKTVYVPPGVAHGFQTLEDNTIVFYQISINYDAKFLRGVRWDDPTFGIKWPLPVSIINARDSNYPFFPKEE